VLVEAANRYLNENTDDNNTVYGQIVYMQGEDANEFFDILDNKGEEQALKYLSQWDNNEYNDVYADYRKVIGSSDNVYDDNSYVMSYNTRHEYASLFVKLNKEDFIARYGDKEIKEGVDDSSDLSEPTDGSISLKFFASHTGFLQNRYKGSDGKYYVLQWSNGYEKLPLLYTATKSWEADTPVRKNKIKSFDFPEGHEAYFYMLKANKDIADVGPHVK